MPFLRIRPFTIKLSKKSRQPSPQIDRFCRSGQNDHETVKRIPKRVSLSVFPQRDWRMAASMTIEAAILLPLLLFFILNLCGAMEILRLHANLAMALRDTGNQISVYGYAYDRLGKAEDSAASDLLNTLVGIGFSNVYVRQELTDYVGREYLDRSPLTQGANGLYFLKSDIMKEQDNIELVVAYKVSPLFGVPAFSSFQMTNHYYGRAWTGYEIIDQDKQQTKEDVLQVYVTVNGTVWHKTKDCTHLSLSVRSVLLKEVLMLRNHSRQSYSLCELCGNAKATDQVYLTDYGDRYHYIRNCSGLKRTVLTIPFSEAYSYTPCSRCTGGSS
jgi:hypothetical protein